MGFSRRLLQFSLRNTLPLVLGSGIWMALAIWCYFSIPVSLLPSLNFPSLSVIVENPGLTAVEMEQQIALPIESAMSGIYHVSRVRSASVGNLCLVNVQLTWGADLELARQQVMQKLANIQGNLPTGSSATVESLSNTLGQVEGFILTGGPSPSALKEFVEYRLRPLLLQQEGVFQVLTFGGMSPQFSVFVDPARLEEFDLTLKDVRDALARNNLPPAPGLLDSGSQAFAIVPETRLTDLRDIQETIIAVKNGFPVRLRHLARVKMGNLPIRGGAEQGGTPGVVVEIVKQPEADTPVVTRNIDRFLKDYECSLPAGVKFAKYYDQSELVVSAIHGVEEAVILGALLVGLILLMFLRSWRASLVAFISIPTSLLSALVLMRAFNLSLNIMTLSALAIATGMVIDDAIVVIENYFRHRQEAPHEPVVDVLVRAAAEVAGPIASSTITTVAIFIPLIFLGGLAGRLFSPVGAVVSIVMMASLFFALTLIPSVGAHLLESHAHPTKPTGERLTRSYLGILDPFLRARWATVLVGLGLSAASVLILGHLSREFLPQLDEGTLLMSIDAPPSSSLAETERVTRLLIAQVLQDPDIEAVVTKTGHAPGAQDTDTMNHSDVIAKLVPANRRKKSIEELFSLFRARSEKFPGVLVDFTMPLQDKLNDAVGGVASAIGVKIFGDDLGKLQGLANDLYGRMSKIPGVVDLHPGSIAPVPAVSIRLIQDQADRYGIFREDLNDAVNAVSFGIHATDIRGPYHPIPLSIRIEGTDDPLPVLDLNGLRDFPLRTATGPYIPLSQVAQVELTDVPARIEHEHSQRFVSVTSNVEGQKLQTVISKILDALQKLQLPKGYHAEMSGSLAAQSETTQGLVNVSLIALLAVAAILWMEFRSIRKALLILMTIPLSTMGAGFALWLAGQTLNVSSLIGLVLLIGIVLRNGIVLVDYIHFAELQGMDLDSAIREGAKVRLRPILMTALSELLGLAPLALGLGSGAELGRPLAIAVIGGLISSTALTLLVLPAAYRILRPSEDRKARVPKTNSEAHHT